MIYILSFIFLSLGFIVGSFLNVVILRFNTQKSLGGRSACMSCQKKLCWYELIPLISFLALKGRCKMCKVKISRQYPIVEFLTGVLFLSLFLKFQDIFFLDPLLYVISFVYYATIFSLLFVVAFYDLRHKIIPDTLSFKIGALSFVGVFFFSGFVFNPHIPTWIDIFAGPIAALPFAVFWLVSLGKWMGLGDAKLVLSFGWLLGLSASISGVVVAFWSGAVVGVWLMLFCKNHGIKSELPFAPFLVLGALVAFLFELQLFTVF